LVVVVVLQEIEPAAVVLVVFALEQTQTSALGLFLQLLSAQAVLVVLVVQTLLQRKMVETHQ
jgi:hypothetical protein